MVPPGPAASTIEPPVPESKVSDAHATEESDDGVVMVTVVEPASMVTSSLTPGGAAGGAAPTSQLSGSSQFVESAPASSPRDRFAGARRRPRRRQISGDFAPPQTREQQPARRYRTDDRVVTFHTDLRSEMAAFAKVKDAFFTGRYPSWSAVGVTQLAMPELLVEIRAVAVAGSGLP